MKFIRIKKSKSHGSSALLVLFICLCFIVSCSEQIVSEFKIEAKYAKIPIVIDGNLNDPVWQQAKPVFLKENRSGITVNDPRLITEVFTCYDDSMIYFAFVCNDPDIWTNFSKRDEYLWQEEAVEVFIDVDDVPNTYVEIEVSPANVLFDSYIIDPEEIDIPVTAEFDLAGIKTAVKLDGTLNKRDDVDSSWIVEIAIPFNDLISPNYPITPGVTEWKINFYRIERDRRGRFEGYAWSPTGARFHKPPFFGILEFEKPNQRIEL